MSGGHFDYAQYRIEDIAVSIEELIAANNHPRTNSAWDDGGNNYTPETMERFAEAVKALRRAAAMAQRVDWLVSGDDGEESFHSRWKEELAKLEAKP